MFVKLLNIRVSLCSGCSRLLIFATMMTNERPLSSFRRQGLIGLLFLASPATSLSLNDPGMLSPSAVTRSLSRSRFLSSTAGTIFVAASALAGDPKECDARDLAKGAPAASKVGDNPRYLDQELEMKYGEGES